MGGLTPFLLSCVSQQDGTTALLVAAEKGQVEAARALIEAGAAVDLANSLGSTSLHIAAEQGHEEGVRVLLGAGADPRHKNV